MSEWRTILIGDYAQFNTQTYKEKLKWEYINYLDTGNITKNKIDEIQKMHLVQDKIPSRAKRIVNTGDVIYSMVRPIQEHYGYISKPLDNMLVSTGFAVITADEININGKFLYYYLSLPEIIEYLSNVAEDSATAYPSITPEIIQMIGIHLPVNIEEQKAIAEILSSLDDKIDLLNKQNKTLEDIAMCYYNKKFIQEYTKDYCIDKIEKYIDIFDNKRIPLSSIERNALKNKAVYPYYGAACIMEYINKYIFDGEYILMGEDGTVETEKGYPVLQFAKGKFWVNNHAHVLKAKKPFTNYTLWFMLKEYNIQSLITGAVQPKINQENLNKIEIIVPSQKILEEANNFFENIFIKLLKNNDLIKNLINLRDILLPKLISGEIRVKMGE